MGKLDGKVVLVTGASRGIGKGIAKHFAVEGAKVVCCARTVTEGDHFLPGSLNKTVAEIEEAGGMVIGVQADVSNEESCENLVKTAKEAFGPVDVLINNAVLSYFMPVTELTIRRWLRTFSVNVHGPFMLCTMVLPDMIERRSGAIVNISSQGAIGPGRGPYTGSIGGGLPGEQFGETEEHYTMMYGATKAAIERFTQGLAEEVYQYGISVACVSPGVGVATEGTVYHKLASSLDDPKREPMKMMTDAILLLATEPLDKVTGRVTYSQEILKEFGWIKEGKGVGIDRPGTGYSQI